MPDPAPHGLVEGAAAGSALPPADRVFLFALLPQVVASSMVLGLSTWRLFPVYVSLGAFLPPVAGLFHGLASPIGSSIFGLAGVAIGSATLQIPISPPWKLRLFHAVGLAYLVTLVVWMDAACHPVHYLIKSLGGHESFLLRYRTEITLLPFVLPAAALLRSGRLNLRIAPLLEWAYIVVLLASLEFGIARDPAQRSAVLENHGPFSWDLAMIGYGAYGTLAGSIVANAILGWLLYALPNQRARWGPGFALAMSAATIIVCSRKLGYWCAAF